MPLIDGTIRRMKPLLAKLIVQPDPIVEFVGEDPDAVEAERKAEAEFNWLFKTKMNAVESMLYVLDNVLHRGYGVAQVGWDYQKEYSCRIVEAETLFQGQPAPQDPNQIAQILAQAYDLDTQDPRVVRSLQTAATRLAQGAPYVKLGFMRVVNDCPAVWDRDPVTILVPPRTTDYGSAEWICVQHMFSRRKLEQMEADGFFEPGSVRKIFSTIGRVSGRDTGGDGFASGSAGLDRERAADDERERIWGIENDDNVLIYELYHWNDIDGDGLLDRTVTFIHPRSLTKLRCTAYHYPFARWPFVKFDFEKTSRRFHAARGISAMLESLQREMNAQHNSRVDAMTLRNAPVYQVPVLAGFKAKNYRAVPGTVLEMPMGSQMTPVSQDRGSYPESVNEENSLRQLAESYIGAFDNTLTAGANDGRTATEVNAAVSLAASTASMDTIIFQLQMRELFTLIWELWLDLRPQKVSYKIVGSDPSTNEPELITVSKSEIDKKFKLIPTGSIANTNHALELSNAREALQFFAADQTGFIDQMELRRWYFNLLDSRIARRVVLPPEKMAAIQTLNQAAAAVTQDPNLAAQMGAPVDASVDSPPPTEVLGQLAP